jgi:hypothetical protein
MQIVRIQATQRNAAGDRSLSLTADLEGGELIADCVAALQDHCWALMDLGGPPVNLPPIEAAFAVPPVNAVTFSASVGDRALSMTAELTPGDSPSGALLDLRVQVLRELGLFRVAASA